MGATNYMEQFATLDSIELITDKITLHDVVFTIFNIAIFLIIVALGLKISDIVIDKLTSVLKRKDSDSILLRFMPILRKVTKVIFVTCLLILALQLYGFSVSALVAGIGVGGVVFGLAAQKTLINILGSVSLIVDNAYKVGDYICINETIKGKDVEGYVEDISLRATKIRCLDGALYNIPNGNLSESAIKNYSHMKKRLFDETINLTYSVTNEQIETAKSICTEILNNSECSYKDSSVLVSSLNQYSVDLRLLVYIEPMTLQEYNKFKDKILVEVYNKFNESGIEFAFPTQTVEIKK